MKSNKKMLIVCAIVSLSIITGLIFGDSLKKDYDEEVEDIEFDKNLYKTLYENQANKTEDLKSLVDCLLKENFSIDPIEKKSLLFGTWKTIDNKTTIRIDNDTFCKTIIINDTTYIENGILRYPTTIWGSDPCNSISWRLVNTTCGSTIIVYTHDYSYIKETFGYSLSEDNTVLIIGDDIYNKKI